MLDERKVAELMEEEVGLEIQSELVVELPSDGTTSHMGSGEWDVYAARCGEFTVLLYYFHDSQEYSVKLI
jgi:hypothetical protein